MPENRPPQDTRNSQRRPSYRPAGDQQRQSSYRAAGDQQRRSSYRPAGNQQRQSSYRAADYSRERSKQRGRQAQLRSARAIRRNRIIFALIILAVIVLLVLGLRACMGSGTDTAAQENASAEAATVAHNDQQTLEPAQREPSIQGVAGSEQPEESEQAASQDSEPVDPASVNAAEPEDLRWRDADFAVNPNRTDWNYESNGRKVVYLTIDDGPSELTQQVLDILDKYNCKATFFVTGHDPDHFHMIKEAYNRGHTIGLHTQTHDFAYLYSSVDAYFEDLNGIGQIVQDQIGYVPCFIRFPGGASNNISANYTQGIMTTLVNEVQARGYQYYDWNVSSGDGAVYSTEELVAMSTEPNEYDNIMFLMHDSATKQTTVEALPSIIEHYQKLGYSFEAIDRSTIVVHHGVNN